MIDEPEDNKTERTIEKHLLCEHNHYTVRAGPNYKRVRVLNYGMRTFVIGNRQLQGGAGFVQLDLKTVFLKFDVNLNLKQGQTNKTKDGVIQLLCSTLQQSCVS